jgi:hypothetical protein
MNNLKTKIRRSVYIIPGGMFLWAQLAKATGRGDKPNFSGWGMVTHTTNPWDGPSDRIAKGFNQAENDFRTKVKRGEFRLTQVSSFKDKDKWIGELRWRHYIIYWSAYYAASRISNSACTLVECGVCDGMSSFFAMSAANSVTASKAFLYDAWAAMTEETLVESEKANVGAYSYLDVANTKKNLAMFQSCLSFIQGRIPESFLTADSPAEVAWMHIDLNSSAATVGALDFFYNKILPGGVILFDDYAWRGYHDTKSVIDQFFIDKAGILLPLPTGQAIFLKDHKD